MKEARPLYSAFKGKVIMKNALVLVVTVIGFAFSFAAPQSVEDDFSQTSVEVYKQKAENGDPKGQYLYAKALAYGLSVQKDEEKAFTLAQKSACAGNAEAMNMVGVFYQCGIGVQTNAQESVKWFEQALDRGCARARENLAMCYLYGKGVIRDEPRGVRLLDQAANDGVTSSRYRIALCRIYGFFGCKKNVQQGVPIIREFATNGDSDAMQQMGILYENGLGVERNYDVARDWFEKAAAKGNGKAKEKLVVYAKKSKDGQYRLVQVSVLGLCESIYDDSADLVAEEMTAAEEYLSNPQVLAKLNLKQKATAELFNAVLESKIRKNFYRIKDGKVEGGSFYHAYRLAAEYPTSYFAHWAYEKMLEWSRMMSDESGANDTTTVSSAEMKRRIRQGLKVERSKKVDNGRNLLDRMCKSLDESKIWRGGMSRDSVMCILDIPKDVRTAYDIAVPCWKRDFTRFSFHGIGLGMQIDEISVLGKRTHVDELGDEGDAYLLNRPILGFTHCRLEVTPNYGEVRKILIFGGGDIGAVRSELVSQGVVFPRERSVRYGTNVDVAECGDVRITLGERGGFSILDTKADARDGGRFEGKGDKKNAVLISRLSSEIRMTKRWIDESNEIANGASGVCGLMLGMSIAEVLKQKSLWATWDYCGTTNEGVRVEKDSIEFDLTDLMKNKRSADRRIHLVLQKPFRGMKDAYLEFTPLSRLHKIELLARWDGSDGGIEDELSVILDLLAKKFSRVDAPIGFTDYKINEKNSLSMLESQFLRIENGIIQPNVRFHWCLVRTHITNRKGWIFEHGNGASYGTRLTAYKKQVSLDSFDSESLLGNASMKSGYQKAFCLESDAVLFHDECRVRLDALEKERSGLEGEVKKATQEDLDAL